MYEAVKLVLYHMLAAKGSASFEDVEQVLLRGVPELTGVVPVSSREELLNSYKQAVISIVALCHGGVSVDTERHTVTVKDRECSAILSRELRRSIEEVKKKPRLVRRQLEAVASILF